MDQLEEIKSKIDIATLIGEYVTLKKAGRNFKARCPFHSENTPSFVVSPDRQIFKCFGCGEGGDIFGFLMKYENIEFGEALRILAKRAGVELKHDYLKQARTDKDIYYQINAAAAEFFQHLLLKEKIGERARAYVFEKRKLSREMIQLYKIGYAAQSWDLLGRFLQKKGYSLADIEKAGLIVKKDNGRGYYDRFRARLMFPVFDLQGNVVGFSGRLLIDSKEAPKYLNTPETPVYNKGRLLFGFYQARSAIRMANEVILAEGNIDVVSAFQAGVQQIVAPLGTALTEDQAKLMRRFSENVILSFDADSAGDKAMRRGIEILEKVDLNIRVVELLAGKDIDECIRINPDLFRKSLEKAVPIYDFYFDSAIKRYPLNDPFNKKKIGAELLPIIKQITNDILRNHYVQRLAELLGVQVEVLMKELGQVQDQRKKILPITVSLVEEKASTKLGKLTDYLLELVLQKQDLTGNELEGIEQNDLEGDVERQIWEKLVFFVDEHEGDFQIKSFCATLEPNYLKRADELFLTDLGEMTENEKSLEIEKCKSEIVKIKLKNQITTLTQNLKSAEATGDEEKINTISKQIVAITDNLKLKEEKNGEF